MKAFYLLVSAVLPTSATASAINVTTVDRVTQPDEVATSVWTGQLNLYKNINLDSLLMTLTFNTGNLCYNLACGEMDDQISSASWKGLPLAAYFDGGSTSLLMFYTGIDCTGISQGWPTYFESAPDFREVGINDAASSFMFLQYYSGVENGVHNICD